MNKLAQQTLDFSNGGGYKGFGALGLEQNQEGGVVFQNFVSSAIGLVSVIAIVWFIFIIISSGIAYMGAGADTKAAEAARKRITSGLVGLLITIFGIFLVNLIGQIFGIPGMLFIPGMLTEITIK